MRSKVLEDDHRQLEEAIHGDLQEDQEAKFAQASNRGTAPSVRREGTHSDTDANNDKVVDVAVIESVGDVAVQADVVEGASGDGGERPDDNVLEDPPLHDLQEVKTAGGTCFD